MVKLYFIANSQIEALELLGQQMIPDAVVWATDFLDSESHGPTALAVARAYMEEADHIFVQPGGKGIFDHASIKQSYSGKTHIIASLYFRGLHPDSCYVGAFGERFQTPSLYHSVVVLDAFKQGWSEKKALEAFNIDHFKRLGLLIAWDTSLAELQKRDQAVDFPGAAFIDNYCREYPGFLNFNHPTIFCLHQYMLDVFGKIGLKQRPMNLANIKDPLIVHDILPVHDFIAEHYGLPYRTMQHWMIYHLGKKFLSRQDYVQRFYAEYRKADPMKLRVHSPADLALALEDGRLKRGIT